MCVPQDGAPVNISLPASSPPRGPSEFLLPLMLMAIHEKIGVTYRKRGISGCFLA